MSGHDRWNTQLILPKGKVRLHGIDFDEDFLLELIARHFRRKRCQAKPMFSDAYGIYIRENPSAHRSKFKAVALQAYAMFVGQFDDLPWTNCAKLTSPSSGTANWPVGCTPTV